MINVLGASRNLLRKEFYDMDKYADIRKNLLEYANRNVDIKAIITIGSTTRTDVIADEFSDLDLIIATDDPKEWFTGEYAERLGGVSISFIEPTIGGGKERRIIYEEDKDVDIIIFTSDQFVNSLKTGVAQCIMNRGYDVLYDSGGFAELIKRCINNEHSNPQISEEEYLNLVNDFYFHNIWACKKLRRGEIWASKMCVDAYLKNCLLKMMELYSFYQWGADVWHDGRFLDQWADDDIVEELKHCFAHYDKDDIRKALVATHKLFDRIAKAVAEILGYNYPLEAEKCADRYIQIKSD